MTILTFGLRITRTSLVTGLLLRLTGSLCGFLVPYLLPTFPRTRGEHGVTVSARLSPKMSGRFSFRMAMISPERDALCFARPELVDHRFAGDKMATIRQNVLRDRKQAIKAHQLIDGASFGPDTLKALGQAFDEAWQEVVGSFVEDPPDARLRLANALLSIAAEDCRDVQILKHAALQRMALDFRRKAVGAR